MIASNVSDSVGKPAAFYEAKPRSESAGFAPQRSRILSLVLRLLVMASAGITIVLIVFLFGYILVKGIPSLSLELFSFEYTSENVSLLPALVNTVVITFAALLVSAPVGICAAIWLAEYSRRGSRLILLVRLAAETLAGIPSIIYGLFGMLMFVIFLRWGYSILAGAFTLAIMVLPVIMRTTENALLSVPDSYREGSFALGAGKLRTIFSIVIPAAMPGILSGVILSIGRIVGETAALIFTAGTVAKMPDSPFSSARTLAVHMYSLSSEGFHIKQSYATAVVLLVLVVVINALASMGAKKLGAEKKYD
ncbi:MAG: phosphate ABC transporter permease PstA [Treponema sp.]|jgi:phosphate transport system permease protein|nr:phosphate ABC transporter permease PstA [Treponema sp.]